MPPAPPRPPMSTALFSLFAFACGASVAVYLTVNTVVGERVGGDLLASLPYFLLGFAASAIIWLLAGGQVSSLARFGAVPWWAFLAGVAAAGALYATTLLIDRLGPDRFFVASVAGQLIISVALAHFAWLGVERDPVTWTKAVGVALVIGGAALASVRG